MSAKKSIENHMRGTLVQVARLYHEGGLSQQEIADRLGVSRSLIAQYLQRAKEAGIVRIQIVDLWIWRLLWRKRPASSRLP